MTSLPEMLWLVPLLAAAILWRCPPSGVCRLERLEIPDLLFPLMHTTLFVKSLVAWGILISSLFRLRIWQ